MAQKFSQFNVENTLGNITSLVGYITGTPGTNVKITPAKISEGLGFVGNVLAVSAGGTSINSYSTGMILYADAANSLATLPISTTTGEVLKVSAAGIPEWGAASTGSQDLDSVLTQGNESPNSGEIKMLDAGGANPMILSQTGLTASPSSNIALTGSGFITLSTSGNNAGISLVTLNGAGSGDISIASNQTGGMLELKSEGLLRFNFENPTANQVLKTSNTSGDMEWVDLPSSIAPPLPDVLTSGSTANTGQTITFVGNFGVINSVGITGLDSPNTSQEVKSSGGNVELNSVNDDVVLKGDGDLIVENTGLGTPSVGDVLTAKTVGGVLEWAAGGGGSSPWTTSGNNIYNNNTANVGIGSTNPNSKLTIEGSGTSGMSTSFQLQQNGGAAWLTASDAGTLSLTSSMSSLGKLSCAQFQLTSSPVAGRVLTADGAGNGSWQAAAGGMTVSTINGNVSPAAANTVYLIGTGMTANAVVTLPAGTSGDTIGVKYISQALSSNTLVVKTQTGKKIDSVVRDTTGLPVPSINTYYEFICDGTDWWIK